MSGYQRINFKDQVVERPKTYDVTNNPDGSITLIDSFGNVEELGTPINSETMGHIEDALEEHDGRITVLENASDYDNFLNKSQITNCITELPQRIKYTLENNIFTVKAGTVLIVPYGVEDLTAQYPKGATFLNENFKVVDTQFDNNLFFVWVELQNDLTNSVATEDSNSRILYLSLNDSQIRAQLYFGSGTNDYSGDKSYLLYRTDENIIKRYSSGVLTNSVCCLPIGFCKADGAHIVGSIEQVFNGMGYIGSTVWVDKGVKGLIPNGRNEDGTLKNIEYITQTINTVSAFSGTVTRKVWINPTGTLSTGAVLYEQETPPPINSSGTERWFNTAENVWYYHASGETVWRTTAEGCVFGYVTSTDGVISNFQPKLPFRAVDYNDKPQISGWAMPSNKYIDLTLGASGSTYIAPANGWVSLGKKTNGANQFIFLSQSPNRTSIDCWCPISGDYVQAFIPVWRGGSFTAVYNAGGETAYFRFIYAQGEV